MSESYEDLSVLSPSTDESSNDELSSNESSNDESSNDESSNDKLSNGESSNDESSGDESSNDKSSDDEQEDEQSAQQPESAAQVDHSRPPAVKGAIGRVLPDGRFQCTRMDRFGVASTQECGATMSNTMGSISSHVSKLHKRNSKYALYQASNGKEPLVCDRPLLNGSGWCNNSRSGFYSLVAHARSYHGYRGESAALLKPWRDLSARQKEYYTDRVDLEKRRLQNNGVYTAEDEILHQKLRVQKFPRT